MEIRCRLIEGVTILDLFEVLNDEAAAGGSFG